MQKKINGCVLFYMKRKTNIGALCLVIALGASVAFSQTANPAKLKVKGVGLDSTYGQVIKALGKPVKDGKPKEEGCIGGHEKDVEYNGLSFYFMDGDSKNGKTYEVKAFTVTSGNWIVSGVKVGDTATTVRAKFGRKYEVQKDDVTGQIMWNYDMGDTAGPGTTTVHFKGGKVVSINTGYMVC